MSNNKMPLRTSKNAPYFSGHPHELEDYLEDVKQQCDDAGITDDDKFVKWACHYAPLDVRTSWEACGKPLIAGAPAVTWADFKKAVFEMYPGSVRASRYEPADLDNFARKQAREAPIQTREQLGAFARTFRAMVGALLESGQVSNADISRCLFMGLGQDLEKLVRIRLETRYPDHRPTMPYTSAEIISAADWVLPGSEGDRVVPAQVQPLYVERGRVSRNPFLNLASRDVPVVPAVVEVKAEPVDSATLLLQQTVNQLANQFSTFLAEMRREGTPANQDQAAGVAAKFCKFCLRKSCPAPRWEFCEEFIDLMNRGHIRNGPDGRAIMRDGSRFPGGNGPLSERIRRVYQNQPSHTGSKDNDASAQSFLLSVFPSPSPAVSRSPKVGTVQTVSSNMLSAFDMEVIGRQGVWDDQLSAYSATVRRTNAGKSRVLSTNPVLTRSGQRNKPAPPVAGKGLDPATHAEDSRASRSPSPDMPATRKEPAGGKGKEAAPVAGPSKSNRPAPPPHPGHVIEQRFPPVNANPRERTGPAVADFQPGAPQGGSQVHRAVQAAPPPRERVPPRQYRATAAVEDATAADRVLGQVLDGSSSVSARDLLAISPDLRRLLRDYVTPRHRAVVPEGAASVPGGLPVVTMMGEIAEEEPDTLLDDGSSDTEPDLYEVMQLAVPEDVVVAAESASLRAVTVLVNHAYEVEGILDGGSQLVSMSESVWRVLGIPLDNAVTVRVQSANGGIDRSLGMCRHVPFMIGGITFYLQVHVVPGAMYTILLGRPFTILAEAVLKDFQDGGQTLSVTDPNSEHSITLPTHGRGCPQFSVGSMQVSRNPLVHMRAAVASTRDDDSD